MSHADCYFTEAFADLQVVATRLEFPNINNGRQKRMLSMVSFSVMIYEPQSNDVNVVTRPILSLLFNGSTQLYLV